MKEVKDKKEAFIERHIIAGLINSTEYLQQVRQVWDPNFMESRSARLIAEWCIEFFDKYGEAPECNIDDIYFDKKSTGLIPVGMDESVEEDLEDLSGEYDEKYNVQYALDQTNKYFHKRHLEEHQSRVKDLIENGDLDAAEELAGSFTGKNGTEQTNLEKVMCTSDAFCKRKIREPAMLLRPWLSEQSLNLIYGPRGAGKTWLCSMIAVALTRQDPEDVVNIGSWDVAQSTSVLFIDGEMNNHMLQQRLRDLARALPDEDPENPLYILSGHDFSNANDKQLNLDTQMRQSIYQHLKDRPKIKVLILDNASALTPGLVENSKEEWDPVNQWMISLRHLGVSVVLVHHASKEGKQRGTSGREDAMDTIIRVEQHKEYNHNEDNAWFTISFQKSRNLKPGASKRDFSLRIVDHPDGGLTWEEDNEGTASDKKRQIMEEILLGDMKSKEIAAEFGISPGRVSQIKNECFGDGYLKYETEKGKRVLVLTEKGEDFLD